MNTSWAFASLSYYDRPLLDAVSTAGSNRADEFTPQQLANTAWSLATHRFRRESLTDALVDAWIPKAFEFQSQGLSNAAWTLGALQVERQPPSNAIAEASALAVPRFETQHIANLAWGCTESEFRQSPAAHAVRTASLAALTQFKSLELGSTIWAFARLGGFPLAWNTFTEADRLRLNIGMNGLSALLASAEPRRSVAASRHGLARELRLLLRCRGELRTTFNVTSAARAAEAGDISKALMLLERVEAWDEAGNSSVITARIRRACGGLA